jgi:hypothetical protein
MALLRTATLPADALAYPTLLLLALGIAAAEGLRRLDPGRVMDAVLAAGMILAGWMGLQLMGILPCEFRNPGGPDNPDAAGVMAALCAPAALRPGRWWAFPVMAAAAWLAGSTTGMLALAAGVGAFAWRKAQSAERGAEKGLNAMRYAPCVFIVAALGLFIWRVDPLAGTLAQPRWAAWGQGLEDAAQVPLGRGLASWQQQFPFLASGDETLGNVEIEPQEAGPPIIRMSNVFFHAHNEYVQMAFELGLAALALLLAYAGRAAVLVLKGRVGTCQAGGIAALIVSCAGWHTFHIAPLALVGCAWVGIMEQSAKRKATPPLFPPRGGTEGGVDATRHALCAKRSEAKWAR